ncbi:peptidase [Actinoplanes subglobosus]|uniref:Peptidase n=1 Tax=Actinoplanes subglobosus TaxID=1547892 RepID=A0ABV8IPW3_9ACTN
MNDNRRLGAALGIAVALVITGAPTPATAQPAAPRPDMRKFEFPAEARRQIPLVQAAATIRRVVDQGANTGYAGIELQDDRVVLWWKGTVPAPVRLAVGAARRTAPVQIGGAAHSLRELRAAGTRLRTSLTAGKPRIKYAVDGSRVVVDMGGTAGFTTAQVPQVGVPVEVVDQGVRVLTSRRDDWPQWKGGADQINGNSRCTTGFPVRNADAEFILTAGHCGSNGNQIRDGVGEFIGTFTGDRDDHDIALIHTPSGADNLMYVGGLDSNVVTTVEGWDWVFPGEYLCQSGGSSARDTGGPVCGLRVEKFNTDSGDAVEARQVDGRPAVRGGDSGGPVFGPSASGNVIAKGINNYTYVGNNTILGFQDFGTATRDYGIWITD